MSICIFEDVSISSLLPLTHVQADFDLRCGIFTALERAQAHFAGEDVRLYSRMGLAAVLRERHGLPVNEAGASRLFLNGRLLLDASLVELLKNTAEDAIFLHDGVPVAIVAESDRMRSSIHAWLTATSLKEELTASAVHDARPDMRDARIIQHPSRLLTWPWDIIEHTPSLLLDDAARFPLGSIHASAECANSVELVAPKAIHIAAESRVRSGVVLDASEGPIVIDEGAEIMPQSVLLGPLYVGKRSRVKVAAKIYEHTVIGPLCKVGGEVEATVFHSFANKQHDGFVGHSYFASWTNLGADSNTSDLKNNYSVIRATTEGREHSTGRMFLGTIMADHAKCGINTMFNTGTVVGPGCNVHGGGFPPKFLPAFSWGGADGLEEYDFEKFRETAERVMARRGVTCTAAERDVLHDAFVRTAAQRISFHH